MRPGWDTYFLGIAEAVSVRGECTRRQVGAVIVDSRRHRIVEGGTGYNGAPAGKPSCLDGACPRGLHYPAGVDGSPTYGMVFVDRCGCGDDWPCPDSAQDGSSYDTGAGSCIAVHAEANALLTSGLRSVGATLYVTDTPCDGCRRLIAGAGIQRVVTPSHALLWP